MNNEQAARSALEKAKLQREYEESTKTDWNNKSELDDEVDVTQDNYDVIYNYLVDAPVDDNMLRIAALLMHRFKIYDDGGYFRSGLDMEARDIRDGK